MSFRFNKLCPFALPLSFASRIQPLDRFGEARCVGIQLTSAGPSRSICHAYEISPEYKNPARSKCSISFCFPSDSVLVCHNLFFVLKMATVDIPKSFGALLLGGLYASLCVSMCSNFMVNLAYVERLQTLRFCGCPGGIIFQNVPI